MSKEFDAKRKELLEELNDILNNAEELFNEKSEAGAEELKKLKKNLSSQIKTIKGQFSSLQEEAVEKTKEVPYKAIGTAGVIGLLLGVLISKK